MLFCVLNVNLKVLTKVLERVKYRGLGWWLRLSERFKKMWPLSVEASYKYILYMHVCPETDKHRNTNSFEKTKNTNIQ